MSPSVCQRGRNYVLSTSYLNFREDQNKPCWILVRHTLTHKGPRTLIPKRGHHWDMNKMESVLSTLVYITCGFTACISSADRRVHKCSHSLKREEIDIWKKIFLSKEMELLSCLTLLNQTKITELGKFSFLSFSCPVGLQTSEEEQIR